MNGLPPTTHAVGESQPRRQRLALLLTGLLAVVAAVVFVWLQNINSDEPRAEHRASNTNHEASTTAPSAWDKLLESSPYRNVRPGVHYVDDARCSDCHAEIAEAYAKHPMGRSLTPMVAAEVIERFTPAAHNPLTVDGLVYQVRQDGQRQIHQERRLSPENKPALITEFEAAYAVGSGRTGRSYLIERDNHLFMSPVTWYADHGWDLSPGYEVNNSHFNRPIVAECLFCHSNRAQHVEGTLNEYQPPIFAGYAIGCQRCHGPGERHVAAQERGDPISDHEATIVNPARLPPHLRESVCQQCHLGRLVRVESRGRHRDDFRPGLPWSAVVAVYLSASNNDTPDNTDGDKQDPDRFVGHVEQMHQSRCYVASKGQLGCISCHDPHELPAESAKVAFYRQRRLRCHGEGDCTLPFDTRLNREPDDSCFACHMPHLATQIRHAATTDHRIPRSPNAEHAPLPNPSPAWSPLIDFQAIVVTDGPKSAAVDDLDRQRNLAVALVNAMDRHRHLADQSLLTRALDMLAHAVGRDPRDVPARQAFTLALANSGRVSPAVAQLESILAQEPNRESALAIAASMLMNEQQWASAAELWQRARTVNPWIVMYWAELARCQARLGRWNDSATTCEEAIKRFPDSFGARQQLIECRLVAGQMNEAQREYERMLELNPPKADSVRRWWDEHPRRRAAAGK